MATVFIPPLLRPLVAEPTVVLPGRTVREIIRALDERYPGVAALLVEDDDIAPGIAISINDQLSQRGLFEPVAEDSEVHILPALAGG